MGIVSSIVDFVFPVQRRLYHPTSTIARNPNQFRSPNLQRRFRRTLWPNGQTPIRRVISSSSYQTPTTQFRRPLARPLPQVSVQRQAQLPPVSKKSFLSEMFSTNINPPKMGPQPKRNGFGSKVLNYARWNNILFK